MIPATRTGPVQTIDAITADQIRAAHASHRDTAAEYAAAEPNSGDRAKAWHAYRRALVRRDFAYLKAIGAAS